MLAVTDWRKQTYTWAKVLTIGLRPQPVLGWVTWEVRVCNFVAVQPNQVCLCHMQIPVEIKRFIIFFFFFFLTTRFALHEYEEIISISPLDEFLLNSNYLTTIDGTLVNNLGAAQYETDGGGHCFVAKWEVLEKDPKLHWFCEIMFGVQVPFEEQNMPEPNNIVIQKCWLKTAVAQSVEYWAQKLRVPVGKIW